MPEEVIEEDLTFKEFRKKNSLRNKAIQCPNDPWTLQEWSNALAGEAGEICNKTKKVRNKELNSEEIESIAEEIGDVVAYADLICEKIGLELDSVIKWKFNIVSQRRGLLEDKYYFL